MSKIGIVHMLAAVLVAGAVGARADVTPLPSEVMIRSEIEKPVLCETRRSSTNDIYSEDPSFPSPFMTAEIDRRPQEGGTLLLSMMDYYYTVNPDLNTYGPYVSSACIAYARQIADGSCAITRRWDPNMNQYVTYKPLSAQVTGRLFTLYTNYGDTMIWSRPFEEAPPELVYMTLNYQITCDGNGQVTDVAVDRIM